MFFRSMPQMYVDHVAGKSENYLLLISAVSATRFID